jgi:hypothetical protein
MSEEEEEEEGEEEKKLCTVAQGKYTNKSNLRIEP